MGKSIERLINSIEIKVIRVRLGLSNSFSALSVTEVMYL